MNKGIIYGNKLDLYIHKRLFIKSNLFNISNMYSTHLLDYIKINSKINNIYCYTDTICYRKLLLNNYYTNTYYRLDITNKLYYYDNIVYLSMSNKNKKFYNMIIDVYNDSNQLVSFIKLKHFIYKYP